MKTKLLLVLFLTASFKSLTFAQGTWIQKANVGGGARFASVGFSIGTKGYIGTGATNVNGTGLQNDFWEYDPITDAWSQKATFGGDARLYATGFSVGDKGYIGTGGTTVPSSTSEDFWEYDPLTNSWTQKANYGGGLAAGCFAFSIGTKGYIGTGYDDNSDNKQDFWEYDPGTGTWTQRADFGGGLRNVAVGFSIGDKGYAGTGFNLGNQNDFWEYNPDLNSWTQKANFGGTARRVATGFSIGNYGYIGLGYDGVKKQDFWQYDPAIDTWTSITDFGGIARSAAVGFSIGTKGYAGTGGSTSSLQDFWEYTPVATGTEQISLQNSISIFSNPSSGEITLIASEKLKNAALTIYNVSGQQVKQVINISGQTNTFSSINLSSGIYFIHISQDNKTILTGKFAIAH
ncbi:MAG TPA: T9SS type A sorting domain-containing protein [Chitinophagales bacterium]|nr:T9SS type A sorting domain-containing protein [Chitinophagales bacterium]